MQFRFLVSVFFVVVFSAACSSRKVSSGYLNSSDTGVSSNTTAPDATPAQIDQMTEALEGNTGGSMAFPTQGPQQPFGVDIRWGRAVGQCNSAADESWNVGINFVKRPGYAFGMGDAAYANFATAPGQGCDIGGINLPCLFGITGMTRSSGLRAHGIRAVFHYNDIFLVRGGYHNGTQWVYIGGSPNGGYVSVPFVHQNGGFVVPVDASHVLEIRTPTNSGPYAVCPG